MADFNPRITGYECVKRVLSVIGLPVPVSASSSTDTVTIQIWAMLTELGQELMELFQWQLRTKTLDILTDPAITLYDIPQDFVRFIDSTGWNMDARIPLIGPMTAQQWALLKARQLGGTTLLLQYRINNNQLELYYSPSEANHLNLEYVSRGWVRDASDPTKFKDTLETDADVIMFEPRLIVAMLRFRWRQAKGFETSALEKEFNRALSQAQNDDTPGSDLAMSDGNGMVPYLGYYNMPDTGYGRS